MSVEVSCAACHGRFRVPDNAAGKRIKCPKCKAAIDVPISDLWTLKGEDGAEYGPVPRTELDAWFQEGRITAECQLLKAGSPQWQWATDVYPDLTTTQAAATAETGGFVIDTGDSRSGSSTSTITKSTKSTIGKKSRGPGKRGKGSPAITYLAYASYALCGLWLLAGIFIIVSAASLAAAFAGTGDRDERAVGGGIAMIVFMAGIMAVVLSIPALLSGYGLSNRKQWGRILTMILGAILLPSVPVGTAYGIWAFIVLLDKKYAEEFT